MTRSFLVTLCASVAVLFTATTGPHQAGTQRATCRAEAPAPALPEGLCDRFRVRAAAAGETNLVLVVEHAGPSRLVARIEAGPRAAGPLGAASRDAPLDARALDGLLDALLSELPPRRSP